MSERIKTVMSEFFETLEKRFPDVAKEIDKSYWESKHRKELFDALKTANGWDFRKEEVLEDACKLYYLQTYKS